MDLLDFGGKKIAFLEVVWNLVGEEEKLDAVIEEVGPEAIYLDIGEEDLLFLTGNEGDMASAAPSYADLYYLKKLSRYGEVKQPSPHLLRVIEIARRDGIPVIAADLDDLAYLEAFYRDVTARELFVRGLQLRWMRIRRFNEPDPYHFSLDWNAALFKTRGYRTLWDERISHIADRIKGERSPILFVSDPFVGEGVKGLLR